MWREEIESQRLPHHRTNHDTHSLRVLLNSVMNQCPKLLHRHFIWYFLLGIQPWADTVSIWLTVLLVRDEVLIAQALFDVDPGLVTWIEELGRRGFSENCLELVDHFERRPKCDPLLTDEVFASNSVSSEFIGILD